MNNKHVLAFALAAIMVCAAVVPIFSTAASADDNNEVGYGSLVISKELGDWYSNTGSITGGYNEAAPTIAKNGKETWDHTQYPHDLQTKLGEGGNNWFQFNDIASFTAGQSNTFALVQGDKLNVVGSYTITYNGNGNYTLTIDDHLEAIGAHVSISNTVLVAKNTNDKAYNKNNIWTTSPGQQQFAFSGNSFSFNAPWVNVNSKVFVYLHLGGLQGYINTYNTDPATTFDVKITGPSCLAPVG